MKTLQFLFQALSGAALSYSLKVEEQEVLEKDVLIDVAPRRC